MPKNKPEIVNVPEANYIAVRGKGNPNEEGGAYKVFEKATIGAKKTSYRDAVSL